MEQSYCKAWNTLTSTLFLPEECRKIEWLIGASLVKSERFIQKICIFYGGPATGKSTILRIIKQILPNYYILSPYQPTFEFAMENCIPAARVGFADDYSFEAIKCMIDFLDCDQKALLFAATNEHPYIFDPHSSKVLKHIIDIPTCGNRIEVGLYDELLHQIYDSELMNIKHKCSLYYIDNPNLYKDYIPKSLIAQKGENK